MSIVERRQFIYKPELSEYYKKWQPEQESLSENLAEFRDFLVNERALLSGDVAKKLGRAITQSDIESFFKSLKDERGPAVTDRNLDKISEMYGLSPENFILQNHLLVGLIRQKKFLEVLPSYIGFVIKAG